jgi:dTDP-4-dehydrorhamnose reductase
MRVAIIGANGQLGTDLAHAFDRDGATVIGLTHADLEITNFNSVSQVLRAQQPDVIVNTAALHHVETCEREPEKAFAVNAVGLRNLALAARELDAVLTQVSTDYVFDGRQAAPYRETDVPRPLNAYGTTKLAGEHFVQATTDKHFVVRTSGLYGKQPCRGKGGLNFVELMLKLGRERGTVRVVDSERVSPTSTEDLARQIVALSRSKSYGLYHATAEGSCSWFEFAREIFSATGTRVNLQTASANEFPAKVPRPSFSVLENQALKTLGLNILKPWQEALQEYLGVASLCAKGQTQ